MGTRKGGKCGKGGEGSGDMDGEEVDGKEKGSWVTVDIQDKHKESISRE